MSRKLILTSLLLLAVSSPGSAIAQTAYWPQRHADLPPNADAAAVYSTSAPESRIVFFVVTGGNDSGGAAISRWFAIRYLAESDEPDKSWADGAKCPQILGLMDWLSALDVPSISTNVRQFPENGFSVRPIPPIVVDGPIHVVEGYGQTPDNYRVFVSMSATNGPLAQWGEAVQRELQGCWSQDRPAF